MLYAEVDKHFIAFNQIGHHSNPVIVPVNIHLAHNGIGFISGKDVLNHQIFAEQQHSSSIESIGIVYIIPADQFSTAEQLIIRHGKPRMFRISRCRQISDFGQQVQTQIFFLNIRIYPPFGKDSLLTDIHLSNLLCSGYFYIGFVYTVIANAFEAVNFGTLRNMDVNNHLVLVTDRLRAEIKRWIQQIGIIGNIDDIADDLFNCIFRNADNFSTIGYPQKNITAQAIQKRTNCFKSIVLCPIPSTLELNAGSLTDFENIFQCFYIHFCLRNYHAVI